MDEKSDTAEAFQVAMTNILLKVRRASSRSIINDGGVTVLTAAMWEELVPDEAWDIVMGNLLLQRRLAHVLVRSVMHVSLPPCAVSPPGEAPSLTMHV